MSYLETTRAAVKAGAMTQATWDTLSPTARAAVADTSDLHPLLIGCEGWRVQVTYAPGTDGVGNDPAAHWNPERFIVGKTTGWRPVHLALRNRTQHGSSITLNSQTPIISVRKIERVR